MLILFWSMQEKEMEKQRLLYQQSRLHNRGAAEMVLQMISACKGSFWLTLFFLQRFSFPQVSLRLSPFHTGETGPMVTTTLKLGISILNGGNSEVQRVCVLHKGLESDEITFSGELKNEFPSLFFQKMLEYLRDKKDVGFFLSLQALMQTCWSVFFKNTTPIWFDLLHVHQIWTRRCKYAFAFSTVSWTWMPLRGRTRQRGSAWFPRRARVSRGQTLHWTRCLMLSFSRTSVSFKGADHAGHRPAVLVSIDRNVYSSNSFQTGLDGAYLISVLNSSQPQTSELGQTSYCLLLPSFVTPHFLTQQHRFG